MTSPVRVCLLLSLFGLSLTSVCCRQLVQLHPTSTSHDLVRSSTRSYGNTNVTANLSEAKVESQWGNEDLGPSLTTSPRYQNLAQLREFLSSNLRQQPHKHLWPLSTSKQSIHSKCGYTNEFLVSQHVLLCWRMWLSAWYSSLCSNVVQDCMSILYEKMKIDGLKVCLRYRTEKPCSWWPSE